MEFIARRNISKSHDLALRKKLNIITMRDTYIYKIDGAKICASLIFANAFEIAKLKDS